MNNRKVLVGVADNGDDIVLVNHAANRAGFGFSQDLPRAQVAKSSKNIEFRHINAEGIAPDGRKLTKKIPVGSVIEEIYKRGGTFVQNGVTYTVLSARGESRRFLR